MASKPKRKQRPSNSENNAYDFKKIEAKWQKKWADSKVFEADPKKGKKKFFTSFVIPYPSGDLHIGHARTFTRTDIIARFKKMQGYNMLAPVGFHATGNRAPVTAKHIKNKDITTINTLKNLYGLSASEIKKLEDPETQIRFFTKRGTETLKKGGFAIDWRRKFISIDKEFSKFITWQFETLRRKGYVVKGSHPVIWCPSCESPITQSDRAEGEEAIVQDLYVWKCPLESGVILPAATLRPETIFAWTNMYLNPDAEYVLAKVGDEKWVLGKAAANRLMRQRDNILIIEEIIPEELIGKKFQNPVTKEWLLVLPGDFVDSSIATGIVASEPSDAPDDHIALEELKKRPEVLMRYNLTPKDIESIKYYGLIDVPGYGAFSGVEICKRMNILSAEEKAKLTDAKKEAYRVQYHQGKLTKVAGKLEGLTIPEAIEAVKKQYASSLSLMYEPSELVICKCGADCYVKILKDQWFLKYGDPKWKGAVKKYMDTELKILPEFWRSRFNAALDWTQNKACARRSGLGTSLPWDNTWVIETLSDSTIYMAYYMLAKYVNAGKLKAQNLSQAFFDYVLLGKGNLIKVAKETKLANNILKAIRSDFEYWYPVDWRNSGKDLVSNHLLYYIYNHIALLPKKFWPKTISVNGFVKISGEKMSKSKGKAITFKTGIEQFGADVVRTVITTTASPEQDSDFRLEEAENIARWVQRFYGTILEISKAKSTNKTTAVDKWLKSRMAQAIKLTADCLEVLNTREAAQACFYQLASDFRWYLRRSSGEVSAVAKSIANDWIKLISVFMPHLSEELWQVQKNKSFVFESVWPKSDTRSIISEIEKTEESIQNLVKDIYHIVKITNKTPKKLYLYAIPAEKRIYEEVADFLSKEFNAKVSVFASNAADYDPEGKAKKAKPGKPGLYLE